jgi:hypothetical protein
MRNQGGNIDKSIICQQIFFYVCRIVDSFMTLKNIVYLKERNHLCGGTPHVQIHAWRIAKEIKTLCPNVDE